MKFRLTTLVVTTALAGPALAGSMSYAPADPVVPAPVVTYVAPANGDWTGPYAGLQLGYGMATGTGGLDGNGAIGGLALGYDYDFGQFVAGGAIEYDAADIDSIARLKLRAGYDLGKALIFASAGAAQADVASLGTDDGWFVGFGYEQRLTETLSLGSEVTYHKFDDFNGSAIDVEATTVQVKAIYRF